MTSYSHLRRGKCCGSGCRHCPYGGVKGRTHPIKLIFSDTVRKKPMDSHRTSSKNISYDFEIDMENGNYNNYFEDPQYSLSDLLSALMSYRGEVDVKELKDFTSRGLNLNSLGPYRTDSAHSTTPLGSASEFRDLVTMKSLIDMKADVNKGGKDFAPFMATLLGHGAGWAERIEETREALKILLDAGVKVNYQGMENEEDTLLHSKWVSEYIE